MINIKIIGQQMIITAGNETRQFIKDHIKDRHRDSIWCDLIEQYSCNGSYTYCGDDMFALSNAPTIAETMDANDLPMGNVYYFHDYMIIDELEQLKNKGKTIFHNMGKWY